MTMSDEGGSSCHEGRSLWTTLLLLAAVSGVGQGLSPSDSVEEPSALPLQAAILTKRPVKIDNSLTATFPPTSEELSTMTPKMYFATDNDTIITSQTGSNALLPCIIRHMDDGMVSWIRRKDRHLLTVGLTTYTSDERYQAIHFLHSEDWTLQIKFVQKRDAGLYECQVSSHPPTSIFIQLNVVEARAHIYGPTDKYVKPGSTLRLLCSVLKTTETPAFVFWYHNSRMINFDLDRGVNVSTNFTARTSELVIPSTGASHAGNYSCVPNNAQPASIYVHIFNGENPAAMQSGSRCCWLSSSQLCFVFILVIITTLGS